ncbi:C2H2 finger domain-containing protein [Pochonia chlamydosporia 170]|uniref:C2H2 finger domain-containing protein n=1 Tax=Pochonia chlamydosporia 170 TaxID=1380566 RepID=A0A179G3T1_METCM|nr:C2H2 finger domain-containing protein [Pochonia chlamydosporia 170]OAQ72524.1 C2H2 finger domain-containing protein [Pochonia chlamydosporia 170]
MASSSVEAPGSLRSQGSEPRSTQSSAASQQPLSQAADPFNLSLGQDETSSPVEHIETPAGSNATLSHYQSSDFSDLEDDPFFGADFNNIDPATPSFLDEATWDQTDFSVDNLPITESHHESADGSSYPLTPTHTASIHTTSPRSDRKDLGTTITSGTIPNSISPQQLQRPLKPSVLVDSSTITPSHSSSNRTSEDGLAPALVTMHPQSPRVTVSVWDKDDDAPIHTIERTLEDSPRTVRGGIHSAGDLITTARDQDLMSGHRDSLDRWDQEQAASRRAGLDPRNRPSDEIPSINQIASQRKTDERNQDVGRWLSDNLDDVSAPLEKSAEEIQAIDHMRSDDNEIPFGRLTENRLVPGVPYIGGPGGEMSDADREILLSSRGFGDSPTLHEIQMGDHGRYQPESSQAAMARFERLCRDNDSIISRSATWGTRRRSFPSVIDVEGVTSGNFLKKLSISRGSGEKTSRPGNFLRDLRGLVRRTSTNQLRKRSRSRSRGRSGSQADAPYEEEAGQQIKRESTPHLSPPLGSTGSGKKPTPSINTTLASMGQNFASMWTGHARSGSISGPSPIASPRASLGSLSVKNSLRRPRSKSEIPKPTGSAAAMESTSSLVDMWRKSGGPPVAPVSRVNQAHAADDDDDDDEDDLYEDNDMRANPNIIDDITPNFAGFQQHVMTLNPGLEDAYGYLVDRIAHQQIIRYKHLLNAKVKHLGLGANCPCGSLCMALGGSANILDQKGDPKGLDPLSAGIEDDEGMPTEGAIIQDSFPQDIPMPPTQYLPAEFECQLCYQRKKFQKPSDWTKHVHEDVQPFTCTWDKCRDPKIFKRKADWVRHENEGHRHLEWWTCDVDDCRHTCYRRDNFLQHLVREHKFLEPKVKTKAAMKRAGGMDATWQKVEQCHIETTARPQDEPCRFCGKTFPTWKKLTVHLAKHMEQISLPVLRLVAAKAKELAADTIISPVQDPPPRQTIPLPMNQTTPSVQFPGAQHMQQHPGQQQLRNNYNHQTLGYQSPSSFMYPVMPPGQFQQQLYPQQFDNIGQSLQSNMGVGQMNQGYDTNQRLQSMQGNQAGDYLPSNNNFMAMSDNDVEPFPQLGMNALGLQNVGDVQMGGQLGGQIGFDPMMDPSSVNGSPFSGHESLSTYSHSPHLNASTNNQEQPQHNQQGQQQQWDERRLFL